MRSERLVKENEAWLVVFAWLDRCQFRLLAFRFRRQGKAVALLFLLFVVAVVAIYLEIYAELYYFFVLGRVSFS